MKKKKKKFTGPFFQCWTGGPVLIMRTVHRYGSASVSMILLELDH